MHCTCTCSLYLEAGMYMSMSNLHVHLHVLLYAAYCIEKSSSKGSLEEPNQSDRKSENKGVQSL